MLTALTRAGIRGVTVSEVKGLGAQLGMTERYAGTEFDENQLVDKTKIDVVLSREQVEDVCRIICQTAYTGEVGDGKIFVLPVAEVVRVRTAETGMEAERMRGGRFDLQGS